MACAGQNQWAPACKVLKKASKIFNFPDCGKNKKNKPTNTSQHSLPVIKHAGSFLVVSRHLGGSKLPTLNTYETGCGGPPNAWITKLVKDVRQHY